MIGRVLGSSVLGIDGYTVEVEFNIVSGLPPLATVG